MLTDDSRTALNGCYVKAVLNMRLLFGEPHQIGRVGDGMTRYWFSPGQRFGFIWWARLSVRRQVAGFAVAEALSVGECGYRLPCVDRAVQVHAFLNCRCVGKDRGVVGGANELIQQILRDDIDPCRVPPVYFRLASQALRVGREPRRIDPTVLQCFLEEQGHAS